MWADTEFGDPRALVWPREGAAPTNDERKNDYYDSLHHASAVVGINTSAQVEAAIVRTPVLTLLLDRFHETQQATLHFSHLRDLLIVADSWETHLAQLSEALAGPADTHDERLNGFVRTFIRPNGLDTAAAPAAADLIEAAAGLSVPAPRTGLLAHVMRWMTPMVERRERRRRAQLKAKSSRSVNSGRAPSRP
jgi:truncated hemoglobin YjbI